MTNLQNVPNYKGLIDKIQGWNWRNWKFNGELEVKLQKSETNE
jgi:hypothetical protein